MSNFRLVPAPPQNLASTAPSVPQAARSAVAPSSGVPKRSAAAHAAYAKANLPESADADAFMAVYDAAQNDADSAARLDADHTPVLRADGTPSGYGHMGQVGATSVSEVAGRDDLELVRGRGVGGCHFVMTRRKKQEPVYVRGYEDELEDELEAAKQTQTVKTLR